MVNILIYFACYVQRETVGFLSGPSSLDVVIFSKSWESKKKKKKKKKVPKEMKNKLIISECPLAL